MISRLILIALLFFHFGVLEAADWSGLWRITRTHKDKVDGLHHVLIPKANPEKIVVYDSDARPMDLESVAFEGETLKLQFTLVANKAVPLRLTLSRREDRVEGDWVFGHVQYLVRGQAAGHRVMAADLWKPFAGLAEHRQSGIIDIDSGLLAKAASNDFDAFLQHWDTTVEPVYYFLFQDWLYGQAEKPSEQRREKLRGHYESLRQEGAAAMSRRFPELASKAVEEKRRRFGDQRSYNIYLINAFAPEAFSSRDFWTRPLAPGDQNCDCKLDLYEQFAIVNPAGYEAHGDFAELALLKELIEAVLWVGTARSPFLEIFRDGLSSSLAAEALDIPLPQPEAEALEPARETARTQLGRPRPELSPLYPQAKTLWETPGNLLGIDLIRRLRETRSREETVRMKDPEVMSELVKYLRE